MVTVVAVGRSKILLEDGCRICAHEAQGGFEPQTLTAWSNIVSAGDVVLDVGAYTGVYSLLAAALGARSIAFEPMSECAARMEANARLNGCADRIDIRCSAVGSEASWMELKHTSVRLTSGASFHGTGPLSRSVPVVSLDYLPLPKISAVKIDAERHERSVIAGAAALLRRDKPALILECLDGQIRVPGYQVAAVLDKRNSLMLPI